MLRSSLLHTPLQNKYVFIRHGQTTANADHIYAGELDVELTDKGRQQAKDAAEKIPHDVDIVFCSPMKRACETAQVLLDDHTITPTSAQFMLDDRLKEKTGGVVSGMSYDEIAQQYPKEWDRDNTPFKVAIATAFPEGESDLDVVKRIENLLVELETTYEGKTILIVSHAGIMLAVRYLLGKSEQEVFADIASCGVDTY